MTLDEAIDPNWRDPWMALTKPRFKSGDMVELVETVVFETVVLESSRWVNLRRLFDAGRPGAFRVVVQPFRGAPTAVWSYSCCIDDRHPAAPAVREAHRAWCLTQKIDSHGILPCVFFDEPQLRASTWKP